MMHGDTNFSRSIQTASGVGGDNERAAFEQMAEPFRRELQLHCYRMLGSFHEAEDLVQETFVRAWRGRDSFEERGSRRGWLFKIATNICLNALSSRARRVLPESQGVPNSSAPPGAPATDIAWLEPYPDAEMEGIADSAPGPHARYEIREAVGLAFVAAIQHLSPRQRAALLLCDVQGWAASEAAQLLGSSTASVNSALQRARATLARRGLGSQPATDAALDEAQRALVDRYVRAWESSDVDGLAALLREDASLSMPPQSQWFRGRAEIVAFFAGAWGSPGYNGFRVVLTSANRQPAGAVYSRATGERDFRAHSIFVLTLHEGEISALTGFIGTEIFEAFGLPGALPADAPPERECEAEPQR